MTFLPFLGLYGLAEGQNEQNPARTCSLGTNGLNVTEKYIFDHQEGHKGQGKVKKVMAFKSFIGPCDLVKVLS